MDLHSVGPKPIIDQHGIDFNKSEPDRYTFLTATLELLQSIEKCQEESCKNEINIFMHPVKLNDSEIVPLVMKYCNAKIDKLIKESDNKVTHLIHKYEKAVNENSSLSSEEKNAWLENIELMEGYLKQFLLNENAFECLLEEFVNFLYKQKIKKITFDLGNNYGFVLTYLQKFLTEHKPPLDAKLDVEVKDKKSIGHFLIFYPSSSLSQ